MYILFASSRRVCTYRKGQLSLTYTLDETLERVECIGDF